MRFSAMLRRPTHVSKLEKYAHVEAMIELLEMELYADAVVGVPGEGRCPESSNNAPLTSSRLEC